MIRLIHTADWQLGKPEGRFDSDVRAALTEGRFDAIDALGKAATDNDCEACSCRRGYAVILLTCRDQAFRHLGNRIALNAAQ